MYSPVVRHEHDNDNAIPGGKARCEQHARVVPEEDGQVHEGQVEHAQIGNVHEEQGNGRLKWHIFEKLFVRACIQFSESEKSQFSYIAPCRIQVT